MARTLPLDEIAPGSVACLFTDEPDAARFWLEEEVSRGDDQRLIVWNCAQLPPSRSLTDQFLKTLAEACLMLWPDWSAGFNAHGQDPGTGMDRPSEGPRAVDSAWRQAAAARCEKRSPPLLKGFSPATQARRLALTLVERQLVFALILEDQRPRATNVLALARGLEWLARESTAGVLAVLPSTLADHDALDGVNSLAVAWRPLTSGVAGESSTGNPAEERKHVLCPVIGRPHPGSPGEQLLAKTLSSDVELAGQFEFNQRVETVADSRFLVDLLCRAGRLVVEVDGYGHHASRSAFNADRLRDYELLVSGYQVLRLPHDFVVQDVELAVARIREVFRFRLRSLGQEVWS